MFTAARMNRRDEEETKIIQNTMDVIDIEDAKRLRLEYNRLCKSGELGSLSHSTSVGRES